MSSEVLRLAQGPELFLSEAINVIAPVPRVHSAATQMTAMGLWCPPVGPGAPGLMSDSSCKNIASASDCPPENSKS